MAATDSGQMLTAAGVGVCMHTCVHMRACTCMPVHMCPHMYVSVCMGMGLYGFICSLLGVRVGLGQFPEEVELGEARGREG